MNCNETNRSSAFCHGALDALFFFFISPFNFEEFAQKYSAMSILLFIPVFAVSFFYDSKITEQVFRSTSEHSVKQKISKLFLFIFLIALFFSVVSFALNFDLHYPNQTLDEDFETYFENFVTVNGGITFLTVSIISILAAFSKQMIKMDGIINKIFTFVGTFLFFSISMLAMTNILPTKYQIYLYTFYHAGIICGIFFMMIKYSSFEKN